MNKLSSGRMAASLVVTLAALAFTTIGLAATAAPPANTSPPTISGTAQVGQTLTATNGTWSNAPASFAYQWLRCNAGGNSCASVANGTQQTYTLVGADARNTIRVRLPRPTPTARARSSRRKPPWSQRPPRVLHRRTLPHRRSPAPRRWDRRSPRTRAAGRGTRPPTPSNGSDAMQTRASAQTWSARPQERTLFESPTWAIAFACASPPGTTRAARPPTQHARRSWRQQRRSQTSAQP